jgi:hypothetical protein
LGVLDNKDHQESDDGGPGVYDQLPSIRRAENLAKSRP